MPTRTFRLFGETIKTGKERAWGNGTTELWEDSLKVLNLRAFHLRFLSELLKGDKAMNACLVVLSLTWAETGEAFAGGAAWTKCAQPHLLCSWKRPPILPHPRPSPGAWQKYQDSRALPMLLGQWSSLEPSKRLVLSSLIFPLLFLSFTLL